MRRVSTGAGTLLLMAFLMILTGIVLHFSGLNLLEPIINSVAAYFVIANTCILMALVVDKFDRPQKG